MFSKRKIKAFISFNWYWFLAIFFVVSVGFYYLFDVIKNPSYDERINVFIATNHIDSNKMEKDLYVGYEDTKIKEVSVDYSDPNDNYFNIIDSSEKAYWLGFIAADGYITTKRQGEGQKLGITLSN